MSLDLLKDTGTPLDRQRFTWKELAPQVYSKLNTDAFTRVRVILMNGVESDAIRTSHAMARMNGEFRLPLAQLRRVEQHQQTMVNWLNPADQNPLETTIGFEQVAIEVTASVAQHEPDPYLAQVYRYGLLEDFDHMYRFAALYDRLEGKDANALLQSYTDILPGRPTAVEHRDPSDDLRRNYDKTSADPLTKVHAMLITAAENQTHDYYMTIGPMFPDPLARQLYAEIASIEEQHTTQYESLLDPTEHLLEKLLMHEAMEAWIYYCCASQETHPKIKAIWERFVDYELGHVAMARQLFQDTLKRDAAEVLPSKLPTPIAFESQRAFVRDTLRKEVDLRSVGADFMDKSEVPENNPSLAYREHMNSEGSPTQTVAAGWRYVPGTELTNDGRTPMSIGQMREGLRQ